jgi:serine/threonine protein kinase
MRFVKGDIINDCYRVMKKIGSGSFGTIYLAEHMQSKRMVAIKTEEINTPYPMVIYEANVTLLL